ncbi:MAG: hypothetical protein LBU71_13435 [Acinetobacter pittii]|jgi:tRNA ligase|nr:hypothetical protein [Acinetobacter pittii]
MNKSNLNQTANLIDQLKSLVEGFDESKKFSRPVTCTKQSVGNTSFTSWRMNEFMYKKATNSLPTMARGLFTVDEPKPKIAIRGYDKFFNLNEAATTKEDYLVKHAKGPFIVTIKENGCIIFVSSFQNQLLVASKHSLSSDHAKRGKYWLQKHLNLVNATENDLIQFLEENQVTLCFELCDDSFEEHILPYSPQHTGLHIHGVNYNKPIFETWAMDRVAQVAERFGFLSVSYKTYSTFEDVFKLFRQLEIDQGYYNNKPIEGVVVRCLLDTPTSDFFFKYKLDEPYLLFREFRELTKNYLTNPKEFKLKLRYTQSQNYLTWLKKKARDEPELFEGIARNHGIVKCRELFYEESKLDIDCTKAENYVSKSVDKVKYVIMTVGTIGCGKTSLTRSLGLLFPSWGHVQSDACKTGKSFIKQTLLSLNRHNVVIAEKNHHLSILRNTLMDSVLKVYPFTKFIALHWDLFSSPVQDTINTIYSRVLKRGKNHPNLTPQSNWNLEKIMQEFYSSFEPFENDSHLYDHIIELKINGKLEENIDKTLFELQSEKCDNIGKLATDDEKLKSVIQEALKYPPSENNKQEMLKKAQYYGIALLAPIYDLVVSKLKLNDDHPLVVTLDDLFTPKTALAYHVTLVHTNEKAGPDAQNLNSNWNYYESNQHNILGTAVIIEADKILFVKGIIVTLCVSRIKDSNGREITKQLPTSRPDLHITMGCNRAKVKPVFSNEIISEYKKSGIQQQILCTTDCKMQSDFVTKPPENLEQILTHMQPRCSCGNSIKHDTLSGNIEHLLESLGELKLKDGVFKIKTDTEYAVHSIDLNPPLSLLGRVTAFK